MLPDPEATLWEALKARGLDMSQDALSEIIHASGLRVIETEDKRAAKAHENRIRNAAG